MTGLIGTVETRLGDLVIDSVRTTPEASDLHALFAVAAERGVTAVVMEVSSHALALDRVGGMRFAVGGYTNFGSDHLDFHRDADDYFAAKAMLFDGRCDVEVLNADDPALRPLYTPATVTYSAAGDAAATWRAADIRRDGLRAAVHRVRPGRRRGQGRRRLPGRHNVANALLAIASLDAVGVDATVAANGVAACARRARSTGARGRAGSGHRRRRLRPQAGRDRRRPRRAARRARRDVAPRRGGRRSACSAPAATGIGASDR